MAGSIVQSVRVPSNGGSVALPSPVTAGNTLCLVTTQLFDNGSVTISDNQSNSWANVGYMKSKGSSFVSTGQFSYAYNVAGGSTTITVPGTTQQTAIILEIAGLKTGDPLNVSFFSTNGYDYHGHPFNVGTIVPTQVVFILVLAGDKNDGITDMTVTGYTATGASTADNIMSFYKVSVAAGSITPSADFAAGGAHLCMCIIAFNEPTTTNYTLSCASGSFAETGTAVGLIRGRKLSCLSGDFAEAGTAATLRCARRLAIGNGVYLLTGSSANLVYSVTRTIVVSSGIFLESGSSVGLRIARRLSCGSGTFLETGTAVTFRLGHKITCVNGVYVLTGSAVTFRITHRRLHALSGSFVVTGGDADLIPTQSLVCPIIVGTGDDCVTPAFTPDTSDTPSFIAEECYPTVI